MTGPTWLAVVVGVVMLLAAAVALSVILVSWRSRHRTQYDIDVHNLLMGVSMAGMLIPALRLVTPGPVTVVWLVVWSLVTVWMALGVARDSTGGGLGGRLMGHHVPHLVMSAGMVYMLAVMLVTTGDVSTSGSAMSGMSDKGSMVPLATLDWVFALYMVGYTVLLVDRMSARVAGSDGPPSRPVAWLHATDLVNVAMGVGMAYMLTMMFA